MNHQEIVTTAFANKTKKPKRFYMTAEYDFELHSQVALLLFNNDWRFGRMGLIQFATLINILVSKACQGADSDPYAEWYLLRSVDKVEKLTQKLNGYETLLTEQMNSIRGFKMHLFTNPQPAIRTLRFRTNFPFQAAILLEKLDYVVRQLRTINLFGIKPAIDITEGELLTEVQNVFSFPRRWQNTGVTRKDILEKNKKAQFALATLKEPLPDAILNQEVKLPWLEKLKQKYGK